MSFSGKDSPILRELAKRYLRICNLPIQDERRRLWRRHNSLESTRPLIYVRAFAWKEMPQSQCLCRDPFLRKYENFFRHRLFWHGLNDDSVFEPWVTVDAVHKCTGWGIAGEKSFSGSSGGSFKIDYPLKTLNDREKLRIPRHEIDERKTAEKYGCLAEIMGDIITINVDRGPAYRMWAGDLSTTLGYLRGIEHFMMDMIDNPTWLHRLMKFLSDGVLKTHDEAEAAGDWGLCAHQNQSMPYALELKPPAANINGVRRSELWGYMAAQEFTGVSPQMHEEFLLQYQLPLLKKFALTAYGCCEDLTDKIDMLRKIPNLRRIAVSPFADVRKCAQQIGNDYVLSYRPSPSDMVSYGLDSERVKKILHEDLHHCIDSHVDITLKDVETVQRDPNRVRNWVKIVREVIDEIF